MEMKNNNTKYDTDNEEKLIIDTQFPQINTEYIKDQCKKYDINFELLNEEKLTQLELKYTKIPTIFQIIQKTESKKFQHTIYCDGKGKIYDSYLNCYNIDVKCFNEEEKYFNTYTLYYDGSIYNNPKENFEENAPQQKHDEGYCVLISLAVARIKARGEQLKLLDKQLQAQQIKQELSTFAEINSEMHIDEIEYNDIPTLN